MEDVENDPWPPGERVKDYEAPGVAVRYDALRCAHAAECVKRLPKVFDTSRRPWIDPSQATAAEVVETITHCPSGALHFRLPGGPEERGRVPAVVTPLPDGPLFVHGDIEIGGHREVRALLCRCGSSGNKPFCDGSHLRVGWTSAAE